MPTLLDAPPEAAPQTQSDRQRRRFRFRLPWAKTAVSASTEDDELLVVNETESSWVLALGYRQLGIIQPGERRRYRVLKLGMLTARQPNAPAGAEYLMLHITPAVEAVHVLELVEGLGMFELRAVDGRRAAL